MGSAWDARPAGREGLWLLRRDGVDVGSIAFIPGAIALPGLHVDNVVRALNEPPPPEPFRGLEQYLRGAG